MLDFKKLFLRILVSENFTDITHLPVPDTAAWIGKGLLVRKLDLTGGPGSGPCSVRAGLVWPSALSRLH